MKRNNELKAACPGFSSSRHKSLIGMNNQRCQAQGVAGCIDYDEWIALCLSFGFRCVACGLQRPLCVDHVQPISAGGMNMIDNVQPLCQACNSSKGTRSTDYRDNPFQVRPRITEDNYKIAAALYKQRVSYKDIAAKLGITQQAVPYLLGGYWRGLDDPKTKR